MAFLLALLLTGCKPMHAVPGQTDADGDPLYRKNPRPTQAYRITMTIEDAPGPFGYISGTAFYDMTNHEQCTPMEPIEGVWSKSKEDGIPMVFQKLDASTYVATIHADGMVDADYYGMGICRFELSGVGITLKATGRHEETRFQPALFKNELHSKAAVVTYFWKGRYPKEDMDDFPDTGERILDHFNEEARHNVFKVTLTSESVIP
ncbi:hypothetical protein GW15_0222095 [Xanthomonas axonopodis pv. vasculorum]|uniref:Lipoprotein n=2 Tax=Xanthomonas axonopodis TaxID=53413 RepID=A0A098PUH6_9XANT|nr:hypothetical protein GW15_0222095 [Xanthomonas axonopodis pv. vasculorum]